MSDKEKKQAVVLGVLLLGFLGFVLIFDPFGIFGPSGGGGGTQQQTTTETAAEQESPDAAAEAPTPVATGRSPVSEDDGLPIFADVGALDRGYRDPAHTDGVWPPAAAGPDPAKSYFDVGGFPTSRHVRINERVREVGDTITDRVDNNPWRIDAIGNNRFRAVRLEGGEVTRWFNSQGYPIDP